MPLRHALSSIPAGPSDLRLAGGVMLVSLLVFFGLAPLAQLPLPKIPAFIPLYQASLVILDLTTAALLFSQHHVARSRALFVLGCGYLFTALITIAHTLTFPGLFSPEGLLGANPQSTAWLYMLWHGIFPLFIIGYVLATQAPLSRSSRVLWLAGVPLLVVLCVALATAGEGLLPSIMRGNGYTSSYALVSYSVWGCAAAALVVLWRKPRRTVLDVWLMATMGAWLCDIGLAAVLNAGRFDLGFYAGRLFGLCAAAFVLVVLLFEYTALFGRLAQATAELAAQQERAALAEERKQLLAREREARAEAEHANRSKDEFLAMLGHELRNPLAPIRSALHLMRLRDASAVTKEREIIERQVTHMVRLVDDLLDVSRITRGMIQIRRETLDVGRIVSNAIELSSPLIEQRCQKLSVNAEAGLFVVGDQERLAQVVSNLLINAAKFTPERGQIVLDAAREQEHVAIRVRDSGMGLSPESSSRMFEPFVQVQQGIDRALGGLGLGLPIVKSLVDLHGGSVQAHSAGTGMGSEFVVRLPAAPASSATPAAAPPEASPQAELPRKRVMVVDDNVDAALTLSEVVRLAGHSVCVAHDGPGALRLAPEFRPQVALLDIGLPAMDGIELAERLRGVPGLERTLLAAITGYGQESDGRRFEQAGFAFHLVKPIDPNQVLRILDGCAS